MRSILLVIMAIAVVGISSVYVLVDLVSAQSQNPEISQNQKVSTGDELGNVISITIEDGISSSDDLR